MKKIIQISFIGILISCQSTYTDYSFEEKILNCFYQQYNDYGIDIRKSIDSATQVLIKHQVLADQSGDSYIELIRAINRENDLPFEPSPDLIKDLKSIKYLPSGIRCSDSSYFDFDSTEFANSKFKYIIGIFDSIQNKGDISPKIVTDEILKVFDKNDLNHTVYKTIGTLSLSNLIKTRDDQGMFSLLPPRQDNSEYDKKDFKILTLNLTSNNDLKIDNEVVTKELAFQKVEDFILTNKEKHVISLKSSRSTEYKFYATIVDGLNETYKIARNKYANQKFKKDFTELNDELMEQINKEIPKNISILEPTYGK